MKTPAYKEGWKKGPLNLVLAASLILSAGVFLHAQQTASSDHFRLIGGFSSASGQSFSASFRLTACLGQGIAGFALSRSYRIMAGCEAFVLDRDGSHSRAAAVPATEFTGSWFFGEAHLPAVLTMFQSPEEAKAGKK